MICRDRLTLWPYYIHVNVKPDILWPRISNKLQDNPKSLEMSDVGAECTVPVYLLSGEKWCFHIRLKQRQRCKWVADTTLKTQTSTAVVRPLIRWNETRHNSEPVPFISCLLNIHVNAMMPLTFQFCKRPSFNWFDHKTFESIPCHLTYLHSPNYPLINRILTIILNQNKYKLLLLNTPNFSHTLFCSWDLVCERRFEM